MWFQFKRLYQAAISVFDSSPVTCYTAWQRRHTRAGCSDASPTRENHTET